MKAEKEKDAKVGILDRRFIQVKKLERDIEGKTICPHHKIYHLLRITFQVQTRKKAVLPPPQKVQ
jgi:hypothetical protein